MGAVCCSEGSVVIGVGRTAISDRSVSLVTEVGIVLVEVKLIDLGLKVSGESRLLPTIRGDSVGATRNSKG